MTVAATGWGDTIGFPVELSIWMNFDIVQPSAFACTNWESLQSAMSFPSFHIGSGIRQFVPDMKSSTFPSASNANTIWYMPDVFGASKVNCVRLG